MKKFTLLLSLLLLISQLVSAQTGSANISGIINTYTKVTGIDYATNSAEVSSTSGFASCDVVLIIQMKGASIDATNTAGFGTITSYNNAGNYERATISRISGNTVYFRNKLVKTYSSTGAVQLVRIPQLGNVTVTGQIIARPWDGNTGGVIALDAANVTLDADIDASGAGFRGGALNSSVLCTNNNMTNYFYALSSNVAGQKGEGIAEYIASQEAGRGGQANGGGGGSCKNGGGGGGSNLGTGGIGGKGFNVLSDNPAVAGVSGRPLAYSNVENKVFLGGGGGAGQQDNTVGVGTEGARGGGIIILKATSISGSGVIRSNGNSQTKVAGADGAGGGGAGGTILLSLQNATTTKLEARGGKGGDNNNTSSGAAPVDTHCHAPGGGGGGGIVWSNIALSNIDVTGGQAGRIVNTNSPCVNTTFGATAGLNGGSITGLVIPEGSQLFETPQAVITGLSSFCTGGSTTLTVSAGPGYTYQWRVNNFLINGATTHSYVATTPGSYQVTINAGCRNIVTTAALSVTAGSSPVPVITGERTICNGSSIVLSTATASGATYQWYLNGQPIQGATNASYTATLGGNYQVELKVPGCTTPGMSAVHAVALLTAPLVSITGQTMLCPSGKATLRAPSGPGYTYQWRFNATDIAGATAVTYDATQTGSYTVMVRGCGGSTTSAPFLVTNYIPVSGVTIRGGTGLCTGSSTLLTSSASGENFTYQWKLNGTDIAGATSATYSATQTGTYTVVVTDPCQGTATSSALVLGSAVSAKAEITGRNFICENTTTILSTPTGTGYTYQWELNGTRIGGATAASYTAGQAGVYRVRVKACQDSVLSAPFTLAFTPKPTPVISGDAVLCKSSLLLKTDSIRGYTYQWRELDFPIPGATLASLVVTRTGAYSVAVTDTCKNTVVSALFYVGENTLATPVITGKSDICTGDSTILVAPEGRGYSYQWQLNGVNIAGARSMVYKAGSAGIYTIVISNACLTATSQPFAVRINARPEATISGNNFICAGPGNTTLLTANQGSGFTYQWYFNNEKIEGAINAFFLAGNAGAYSVDVTNANKCTTRSALYGVNISRVDESKVSISRDTLICENSSMTLRASGGVRYLWSPATGLNDPESATPVASPKVGTLYRVKIYNANGCFVERQVSINVIPAFAIDFEAAVSSGCGQRTSVQVTDKTTGAGDFSRYKWTMGDGTTYTTQTPPPHVYRESGIYSITLEVNNGRCTQQKNINLTVQNMFIPNVITPNNDNYNDVLVIDRANTGWQVEIYDRWGKLVYRADNYANDWGREANNGIYFYRAVSPWGSQCKSTLQIIKD